MKVFTAHENCTLAVFVLCYLRSEDPEVDIGNSAWNIRKVQRAFQHAYDTLIFNNSNAVSILKLIITADPNDLKAGWKAAQQAVNNPEPSYSSLAAAPFSKASSKKQ